MRKLVVALLVLGFAGSARAAPVVVSAVPWTQTDYTSNTATLNLAATNFLYETIAQGTPAPLTINLPSAPPTGTFQCVKDRANNFQANNATVKTTDSSTIDNRTSGYLLAQNAQEACFLFNAAIGANGNWSLSHAYIGDATAVAQEANARSLTDLSLQPTFGLKPNLSAQAAAWFSTEMALRGARAYIGSGRTQSGTSDSPNSLDCGTTITYTAATAIAVTLPTSGMPTLWCHIGMLQQGAGKVTPTISAAAPKNAHSWTGTSGQNAFIGVSTPDGGTTWYMSGDGA